MCPLLGFFQRISWLRRQGTLLEKCSSHTREIHHLKNVSRDRLVTIKNGCEVRGQILVRRGRGSPCVLENRRCQPVPNGSTRFGKYVLSRRLLERDSNSISTSSTDALFLVVELEDIGTVGSDGTPLSQDSPYSNDPSSKERVAMGLPLAFGTTKKSYKKGRSSSKRISGDGSNVNPAKIRTTMKRPLLKYWLQRYSLFSRFDEGIAIDEEGWYSTTPECIAVHQAKKCRQLHTLSQQLVVLDGFCGVGGNTIQFAASGHLGIAMDIDENRLKLARGNYRVYEVGHGVEFIHGDFFTIARSLAPDVVFLSQPWGCPEYLHTFFRQD